MLPLFFKMHQNRCRLGLHPRPHWCMELTCRAPRKIIVWISKVFIPPYAPCYSKRRQTRNRPYLRRSWVDPPQTPFVELYLTGTALSQEILWIWNICINYIGTNLPFKMRTKLAGGWGYDQPRLHWGTYHVPQSICCFGCEDRGRGYKMSAMAYLGFHKGGQIFPSPPFLSRLEANSSFPSFPFSPTVWRTRWAHLASGVWGIFRKKNKVLIPLKSTISLWRHSQEVCLVEIPILGTGANVLFFPTKKFFFAKKERGRFG